METRLLEIINEILENDNRKTINSFTSDTSLRKDLGFDSLNLAVLTVMIEDEFGVDLFADRLIDTVGEVIQILKGE
ncbi:acyl carrier protein [bacterium LRH843]|nr:acyl carrier protein [bacterium LRH843]